MYIVLEGPPGSGKGTQGQILAKFFKISHLSTGDLLREILKNASHPLFTRVEVINEGQLVTDEVVNRVVEEGIKRPEYENGIVFDGFPRTVSQAESLNKMLSSIGKRVDLVVDFDATEEVLLFRLSGRRICPECGAVFHIKQGLTACPDCKVDLIQREDDNPETIIKRFREYKAKTAPLKEFYKNSGAVYLSIKIDDASKSPKDVQDEIVEQLKQLNVI